MEMLNRNIIRFIILLDFSVEIFFTFYSKFKLIITDMWVIINKIDFYNENNIIRK